MESKSGFQRTFLIFGSEDAGYDLGQKPSGHVRIECRDGRGKLWAVVHNLNGRDGKLSYKLYLVRMGRGNATAVYAGMFDIVQTKAELEWEFNPANVQKTGFDINGFDAAVVLAEHMDRENTRLQCPLAAYRNKKFEWRKDIELFLYKLNIYDNDTYQGAHHPAVNNFNTIEEVSPLKGEETSLLNNEGTLSEKTDHIEHITGYDGINPPIPMNTKCMYINGNTCGMYINTSGINPCNTCTLHSQRASVFENNEKREDLTKLKGTLDRNFEQSDPFHSRRSDYRWWKVTNPANLNNILYQNNIRSPLLFNPMVMMAHFKFRHLIVGIYTDKLKNKEYVVCGVPGMHMVDKRPFGELCKWVQAEGNKPKYGAFGYWIVYIDPWTGKILSLK